MDWHRVNIGSTIFSRARRKKIVINSLALLHQSPGAVCILLLPVRHRTIWQWYIHSIKYWHATLCNLFQSCMLLISFPILTVSFISDEMDTHQDMVCYCMVPPQTVAIQFDIRLVKLTMMHWYITWHDVSHHLLRMFLYKLSKETNRTRVLKFYISTVHEFQADSQ